MHEGCHDILHQRRYHYKSRTLILSMSVKSTDYKILTDIIKMSIRSLEKYFVHENKFFHDFDTSVNAHGNTIFKTS